MRISQSFCIALKINMKKQKEQDNNVNRRFAVKPIKSQAQNNMKFLEMMIGSSIKSMYTSKNAVFEIKKLIEYFKHLQKVLFVKKKSTLIDKKHSFTNGLPVYS